ncbi:MAG: bifunctional hydroxymethylpyrimidine kinase/phosphomethylpyrimidine kinase [Cohaesibacter sp.]|jgi:hydroxymethylpyrimidine/phosphomethylpyrimidine kinase|nr:bifunctional hydroxymethylpyrimidine kinase/phosphomethylpyrimidine kinase [Cohaesibacter sp.]
MIATALSIAGSDPSGGAGIQADLKTFSARGVYGMTALTALTAQNTQGVSGVHLVPPAFVADQIKSVFKDIRVDAVKIGMIANAEIAEAVADSLGPYRDIPIVLDPVMIAKGGHPLLARDAMAVIRTRLLPLAHILTPNLPEAGALLDQPEATSRDEMVAHGEALCALGPSAILMKGGHLEGAESPDVLISKTGPQWYEAKRIETVNTHGTGCTLSAALAAELAKGEDVRTAVANAKAYLAGAVAKADSLGVGSYKAPKTGHGPTHHFHDLWAD